jgi:hypothetical protein
MSHNKVPTFVQYIFSSNDDPLILKHMAVDKNKYYF